MTACNNRYAEELNRYNQCVEDQTKRQQEKQAQEQEELRLKQEEELRQKLQEEQRLQEEQLKQQTQNQLTTKPGTKKPKSKKEVVTKTMRFGVDIRDGQTVTAKKGERIIIEFEDGSRIQLDAGSTFYTESTLPTDYSLKALKGKFHFFLKKLVGRRFTVRSVGIAVAVRGTEFTMDVKKNKTVIQVLEGVVMVTDSKGKTSVDVEAGYQITATKKSLSKPKPIKK